MRINRDTNIASIIKHNPASIEAISTINKHFKKLKNPILRKLFASRVTIADAAKIGGVTSEVFFEMLKPLGFEIPKKSIEKSFNNTTNIKANSLSSYTNIIDLDVRPILEGGVDPFKAIMKSVKKMEDGQVLKIVNTFEPIPLITILRKKGFYTEVERPDEGIVHTFIKKQKRTEPLPYSKSENGLAEGMELGFMDVYEKYKNHMVSIDVRALEMPEPMVNILKEIEALPRGKVLYVKHKKFPKYLIPELKDRGYYLLDNRIDDNNIDLLIYKL